MAAKFLFLKIHFVMLTKQQKKYTVNRLEPITVTCFFLVPVWLKILVRFQFSVRFGSGSTLLLRLGPANRGYTKQQIRLDTKVLRN